MYALNQCWCKTPSVISYVYVLDLVVCFIIRGMHAGFLCSTCSFSKLSVIEWWKVNFRHIFMNFVLPTNHLCQFNESWNIVLILLSKFISGWDSWWVIEKKMSNEYINCNLNLWNYNVLYFDILIPFCDLNYIIFSLDVWNNSIFCKLNFLFYQ